VRKEFSNQEIDATTGIRNFRIPAAAWKSGDKK
jgi:hypothetical protein